LDTAQEPIEALVAAEQVELIIQGNRAHLVKAIAAELVEVALMAAAAVAQGPSGEASAATWVGRAA
jgi:hypothetical protein